MSALRWSTLDDVGGDPIDTSSLIYLGDANPWWALQDNGFYNQVIRFPTLQAHARQPAPWCMNGIYLGVDNPAGESINFTSGTAPTSTQYSGLPLTYERGDVVWQSLPLAGGALGQVCIYSGTQSFRFGIQTASLVNFGDTTVTLNKVGVLATGLYITIGDGVDVYKILKVTDPPPPDNPTIDITPGALIGIPVGAAITPTIPTAAPVNVGDTQVQLENVEGLVPGQYIKIGDAPDTYKIVKVTLATMDIAPGALIGVAVGAAIAIAGGAPVGMQTSKTVNKGDTTVMLDKADGLMPGQNVTIGGDGAHVYTIVTVTLPTIDIASITGAPGAHAVVPVGKAIAFSPAAFSTFGEVENVGNSVTYGADAPLLLNDRYVTVIATATMTLPAKPGDGETHSIKSQAGVTTKVVTEGGALKIDGGPTATVLPGQNGTFRYSAAIGATGEWERR